MDLSDCTTSREMISFLRVEASRAEVAAVCTFVNNKSKFSVPSYGTKEQLLYGLRGVNAEILRHALLAIFYFVDGDDSEGDLEDDDCESEDEEYDD